MENCVDIVPFGVNELVVLKQPGSVRHPQGAPITKIEMIKEDARELAHQLVAAVFEDCEIKHK